MNIEKLNQAFVEIIEKKSAIRELEQEDIQRIPMQIELHEMEREFHLEYGAYIQEALFDIHDEYCPDNDILLPVAYFASNYLSENRAQGKVFDVPCDEGVEVEVDDFPGVRARLVLVPNPVRFILQSDQDAIREVVWVAGDQ